MRGQVRGRSSLIAQVVSAPSWSWHMGSGLHLPLCRAKWQGHIGRATTSAIREDLTPLQNLFGWPFSKSMLPLLLLTFSSHRPSPIFPVRVSPPIGPETPTGISVLIFPNDVSADTV